MTIQSRWQFCRAGITNVYQYENEVFSFRDGRLLLRGINGSGKSTAMNMLLPFLLTGKTRGIDAAGEQTGVLKSWMLSGRDERQPVGYLWLEFVRPAQASQTADAEPEPEYVAIGCGIKANRASDTVNTWWFVTSRRPSIDFELLEQQVPLSADALRTVIQPDVVFAQDRRADYRLEVGRRLYGGAPIDSFLDLINTVRSPRVGDRVDVDLPQYLVAALPNLSEQALLEAARPLDDLDEHRRNVGELASTVSALATITEVYRSYAIAELQRESASSRETLTDLRRARRAVQSANEAWLDAQQQELQSREALAELEVKIEQFEQQINALERSPAYTEGQQLEDLRRHVMSLQTILQKDKQNLDKHEARQPGADAEVVRNEQRTDERWQQLSDELMQIGRGLEQVALQEPLPGIVAISRLPLSEQLRQGVSLTEPLEPFDSASLNAQLKGLSAASTTRKLDLDTAGEQLQRVKDAAVSHDNARAACSQAIESVEDSNLRFEKGRTQLQQAREAWTESVSEWMQAANAAVVGAVTPAGFESIEAPYLAAGMVESTADFLQLRTVLSRGINNSCDAQRRITIALEAQVTEATAVHKQAIVELDKLNAMTEPEVPLLVWQQRAALCFADLVDFHDNVSDQQRAGLEAAMEASGLLSATIKSNALQLENGELVAAAAGAVEHPLSALLKVTLPDNCDIDAAAVQNILDAIATHWSEQQFELAATVVTIDGRFRLGALSGRHTKACAEYIGISARRQRLEQLRREAAIAVEQAKQALAQLESKAAAAQKFSQTLDDYRRTLPVLDPVDAAQAGASALEEALQQARDRLVIKERELNGAEKALSAAEQECHRVCRSLRLPVDSAALNAIAIGLDRLVNSIDNAQRTSTTVAQAFTDWTAAADRWRLAQQDLKQAGERYTASQTEYDTQHARLTTLEATLGTSYAEVVAQITDYQSQAVNAKGVLPAARQAAEKNIRLTQAALNEKDNNLAAQDSAEQRCAQQYRLLYAATQVPGLLTAVAMNEDAPGQVSLPSVAADSSGLEALTNTIQALLPADVTTGTTADGVRISLRKRRSSLGAGWDAEDYQPDNTLPISVTVNGPLGQMPLPESLHAVRTQLKRLQALLTEKQDQALRNLLQGLIAREVAEKMFQASRLIDRMNERLGSVTSTHGIGVRLRWRQSQELDDTKAATVKILAKRPDLRSEEEESTLRVVLADALEEARRMQPDAPYRHLIAQVFDYRDWHDMAILLRRGEDTEKRLTRRTPLSEGEKKLVSYLPLFAAVAASCDAISDVGGVSAPRFLLLDDAFAKVSEDNHAALFGLLVDLDLDFIATSERLWGTHASVPGLAITEVVRDTTLGAILLEHSLWDGNTLHLAAAVNIDEEVFGNTLITVQDDEPPS